MNFCLVHSLKSEDIEFQNCKNSMNKVLSVKLVEMTLTCLHDCTFLSLLFFLSPFSFFFLFFPSFKAESKYNILKS